MISVEAVPGFDSLVAALAAKAEALAVADAQNAALAQGNEPIRWRRAGLLWPTFAPRAKLR